MPVLCLCRVHTIGTQDMFESEVSLNEFQLGLFEKMIPDIDESTLYQPGLGHGHPPVWLLGHLAMSADLGRMLFGKRPVRIEWIRTFGPGSTDTIAPDSSFSKETFCQAIREQYRDLRGLAAEADPQAMKQPTTFELFQGTAIQTVGHVVSHLLTSHFAFHLAQLSSCRRAAGHKALF